MKGERLGLQLTDEARAYYDRDSYTSYTKEPYYMTAYGMQYGIHWLTNMDAQPPIPGITKGQAEEAMLRYRIGNAMAIFHMPTDRT